MTEQEKEASPDPDELDKEQIEQLHAATLQISGNCFELKKLCATVLVAAGTLVATFTYKRLDTSVFVAGLGVVLLFWVADSQSYYIQAKLRRRMKETQQKRVDRHATLTGYAVGGVGLPIEAAGARGVAVRQAFLNASMLYYAMIALIVLVTWVVFAGGRIS